MKTYLLQLIHNCISHPILGVLGYPAPEWAIKFHNWTAELAFPGHVKYVNESEKYDVPEGNPQVDRLKETFSKLVHHIEKIDFETGSKDLDFLEETLTYRYEKYFGGKEEEVPPLKVEWKTVENPRSFSQVLLVLPNDEVVC